LRKLILFSVADGVHSAEGIIPVLLTAILNTVDSAAGNALLTAEQRNIALCVLTITQQYFNHGRSTVVSMPTE
jgi:hypothetical protein